MPCTAGAGVLPLPEGAWLGPELGCFGPPLPLPPELGLGEGAGLVTSGAGGVGEAVDGALGGAGGAGAAGWVGVLGVEGVLGVAGWLAGGVGVVGWLAGGVVGGW